MTKILAIESSCDDLSVCLFEKGKVLALCNASQTTAHAPYGGVVPEIASREHLNSIVETTSLALKTANLDFKDLDALAATYAPGLLGSVLVGLTFAKSLSFCLKKSFIGIHHIEAHLTSPFLENEISLPALGLVVSGGHTHLYSIPQIGKYIPLGHTVDDAVGEAFDKVGKILGLPYPGGPEVDKLSQQGDSEKFKLSLPNVKANPLHVSYSGLKTAVDKLCKDLDPKEKPHIAASFQKTAIRILERMLERALQKTRVKTLLVSGGVACNSHLRKVLGELQKRKNVRVLFPSPKYCTDNAAMVAWLAEFYLNKNTTSPLTLDAYAHRPLGTEPSVITE